MTVESQLNPAEEAARRAQAAISECLKAKKSFLLEAGAGAGKTYSLVAALKELIAVQGNELLRENRQIACITYTNVASDEIKSRIDKHPSVATSTIHSFCWSLIQDFQPHLRAAVAATEGWQERLAEIENGIGLRAVEYDLGLRSISEFTLALGHSDVIAIAVSLLNLPKFRQLFEARFPILFIDEYQDTNSAFAAALKQHFIDSGSGPLIGLFGDHWQKIYPDGCGKVEGPKLVTINKGANFRSAPVIVRALNHLRPELVQAERDPQAVGTVAVYHTNAWTGSRRTENHWQGDLPAAEAHKYLGSLEKLLVSEGWIFDVVHTKVLMLTNALLAKEQGYSTIEKTFKYTDAFLNKQDTLIEFLVDRVEPVCAAYAGKRYGDMFAALESRIPRIRSIEDKRAWSEYMEELLRIRSSGTIGDVFAYLSNSSRLPFPERVERRLSLLRTSAEGLSEAQLKDFTLINQVLAIPYSEIVALDAYIDDKTPFSTKHGVKGQEFENVLVVCGRGWNNYDFSQMLEWFATKIPPGKEAAFERNRNLFYVSCSRPIRRLALLFMSAVS